MTSSSSSSPSWADLPASFHQAPITDRLRKLSADDVEFAAKELNEPVEKDKRFAFLRQMRERLIPMFTIEEVAEYEIRFDYNWLIRFARARKFDLDRSVTLFENLIRFRQRKNWGKSTRPPIGMFLSFHENSGVEILSSTDKLGRTLMYMDAGKFKIPAGVTMADLNHVGFYMMMAWISIDNLQIRGVTFIQNLGNMSFFELLSMSGGESGMREMQKERMEMMNNCTPMRLKQILSYQPPWWVTILVKIASPFMSQKMKDRAKFVHYLDDLLQYVDYEALPIALQTDTTKANATPGSTSSTSTSTSTSTPHQMAVNDDKWDDATPD